jgi:probable F420-dependent oxidoreductase
MRESVKDSVHAVEPADLYYGAIGWAEEGMMQIGVVYPQTELEPDPMAVREYAQGAEAMGYRHVLAYEHVLGANPQRPGGWSGRYNCEHSFMEPFTLFSYLSGVTEQMGFITGILILPQRQTALVAKQAATLDRLCGGRLRLGIGVGWNPIEYTALNQDFSDRGIRSEEQVKLLRQLWTEPLISFDGRWHHIPDAGINPLPRQQPIPIWFGGHADTVLRRMARHGEGWLPDYRSVEEARPSLDGLGAYLEQEGRALEGFGLEPRVRWKEGGLDLLLTRAAEWRAAGASHLSINTMGCGFSGVNEHLEALRAFAEVFIP